MISATFENGYTMTYDNLEHAERIASYQGTAVTAHSDYPVNYAVALELLPKGRITAILQYRFRTGAGLKEAIKIIDSLLTNPETVL